MFNYIKSQKITNATVYLWQRGDYWYEIEVIKYDDTDPIITNVHDCFEKAESLFNEIVEA